jgi:hypothetical protein
MTKYQKTVDANKEQFIQDCLNLGWEKDRFGNLKKTREDGTVIRIAFRDRVARYERKLSTGKWNRILSAKLEEMKVVDGKLSGFRR